MLNKGKLFDISPIYKMLKGLHILNYPANQIKKKCFNFHSLFRTSYILMIFLPPEGDEHFDVLPPCKRTS